jgi:hypothetical protein
MVTRYRDREPLVVCPTPAAFVLSPKQQNKIRTTHRQNPPACMHAVPRPHTPHLDCRQNQQRSYGGDGGDGDGGGGMPGVPPAAAAAAAAVVVVVVEGCTGCIGICARPRLLCLYLRCRRRSLPQPLPALLSLLSLLSLLPLLPPLLLLALVPAGAGETCGHTDEVGGDLRQMKSARKQKRAHTKAASLNRKRFAGVPCLAGRLAICRNNFLEPLCRNNFLEPLYY